MPVDSTPTIFTIRLTGENVRSDSIPAGDLAALLVAAEQTVASLMLRSHPELSDSLVVGLAEIRNESIGFAFTSNEPELAQQSYGELVNAVDNRFFRTLPARSLEGLGTLTRFTRERSGHTQFWNGGPEPLLDLPPDYAFEVPKPDFQRGETVIFGKVERVGGVRPRVRLKVSDREIVYADITEEQGRELGTRLYKDAALRGLATWDAQDGSIAYFRVDEVLHYERTSARTAFDELAKAAAGAFDDIDDVDLFAREVREGSKP